MSEQCMLCKKVAEAEGVYLCREHAVAIAGCTSIIDAPVQSEHCHICGEHENRKMICYDGWFFCCTECLEAARKAYGL